MSARILHHVNRCDGARQHAGHIVRDNDPSPAHSHELLRDELSGGRLAGGCVRDATLRASVSVRYVLICEVVWGWCFNVRFVFLLLYNFACKMFTFTIYLWISF